MTGRRISSAELSFVLGSVALGALGQVLMRAGMASLGGTGFAQTVLAGLAEPLVWAGVASYVVSSALWLVALSRVPLSVAYPFGALSYVLVVIVTLLTGEQVGVLRWLGVACIVIGIWLIGGAGTRATPDAEDVPA